MRLYRLLAITILLLNRDQMNASELADYFEVSVRTIYRDLETINQAGIPIISYQGSNGGFGIVENYKIDKYLLTPEEISSVITALNGVSKAFSDQRLVAVMEKMKGLIPKTEKERLPAHDRVIIDFIPWGKKEIAKEKVNLIRRALEETKVISFEYINRQGVILERQAEPVSLIFKGHSWYCYCYCRLKADLRLFKLSRMRNLSVLEESFQRREIVELDWEFEHDTIKTIDLVLRFSSKVRGRVEDFFDFEQIELLEDGSLDVRVSFPEDEWVYSYILSYGCDVKVIKPAYLRKIIQKRAKKILEIYDS